MASLGCLIVLFMIVGILDDFVVGCLVAVLILLVGCYLLFMVWVCVA